MPSYSLLTVVQKALTATNSFEVNSIDDTPEAQSIADFAEDVYNDMVVELPEWQFQEKLLSLESSLDNTRPNYMKIPAGVTKIKESSVEYNVSKDGGYSYRKIKYLEPQDFLELIQGDYSEASVEIEDYDGTRYMIKNDRMPTYFTTFDGVHLAFDSFDSSVDSTLQETKSRFIGTKERDFTRTDDFLIPLPEHLQSYYLAGVRAKASEYLSGEPLVSDIRKYQAGLAKARVKHKKVGGTETYSRRKNYGRN